MKMAPLSRTKFLSLGNDNDKVLILGEKLLTEANRRRKVGSTSKGNFELEEQHIPEFEYFENPFLFKTPKNFIELSKHKPLVDLSHSGLSFSEQGKLQSHFHLNSPFRKPISPEAINLIQQHLQANMDGINIGNPPPPLGGNLWGVARFSALQLPTNPHDMPKNDFKLLPKFSGDNEIFVDNHIYAFQDCVDNLPVDYEDVYMRIFVQILEGEARKWFRNLPANSIDSWATFHRMFMEKWGEKKDHQYYLSEFGSLKKKNGEIVDDLNKRFNKMYNKIPADIRPSQAIAKVTYAAAHDPDFAMMLRERRSATLDIMQNDVVDIEEYEEEEQGPFEVQDSQDDMNWLGEEGDLVHLTQGDYEESLDMNNQWSNDNQIDDLFSAQYRLFADALQAKLHHKYDLRPRPNAGNQNPKVVDPKKKMKHQRAEMIIVEPVNTTEKDKQHKDKEKSSISGLKDVKRVAESQNQISTSFNFMNELSKIKVPIPLTELAKIPTYQKELARIVSNS
eukprot:Gb_38181 [translate_table: standard]